MTHEVLQQLKKCFKPDEYDIACTPVGERTQRLLEVE